VNTAKSFIARIFPENARRIVATILTAYLILGVSILIIAYGRGYRFNFNQKSVSPTGLVTATSDPNGAFVYINGKKYGATNANIQLPPDWYTVTIAKDGYQPWEKKVRVQGEIIARADAMLFPKNPSLYTIINSGVVRPVVSPDGTKLAYNVTPPPESTLSAIPTAPAGLYVLDLVDKPLGVNRDARMVLPVASLDTTRATLTWSPDSKQILIEVKNVVTGLPQYYLVSSDVTGDVPKPVPSRDTVIADWTTQQATLEREKLLPLKQDFIDIATSSMQIVSFSPDERKILYEATASATIPQILPQKVVGTNPTEEVRDLTPGNLYVYDIKEDRNYLLGESKAYGFMPALVPTPTPSVSLRRTPGVSPTPSLPQIAIPSVPVQWLPTSHHLIIVGPDRIDIMEYDGANRVTVYAGPFEGGFVAPWTNSSKLLILTNLNPTAQSGATLYGINIR
jgi:hypothetical protein